MDKIMQFFSVNKDALTAIGIILTFSVSVISLYFSFRNNKESHYTNTVTKNRVEWIYTLRELCSRFIASVNMEANYFCPAKTQEDSEKVGNQLLNVKELSSKIEFMLNFSDEIDKKIIECVINITNSYCSYYFEYIKSGNSELFVQQVEELNKLNKSISNDICELKKMLKIYMKSEWNRVKYESQGRIYEKETQEFDIMELEKKYDNPEYKNDVWKRFFINAKAKVKRICYSPRFIICIVIVISVIFVIA